MGFVYETLYKLKNIIKNKELLFKHIIFYAFLLIIPVIIITVIMFKVYFASLEKETVTSGLQNFQNTASAMNNMISELNTTAFQGFNNPYLKYDYDINEEITFMKLESAMKTFLAPRLYIQDIFISDNNNGYIYSSNSVLRYHNFLDHSYKFLGWNEEKLTKFCNKTDISFEYVNTKEEEYLICVFPENNSANNRSMLFILKTEYIQNILKGCAGDIVLFDNDLRILNAEYLDTDIDESYIFQIVSDTNTGPVHTIKIKNKDYIVFSDITPSKPLRIVNIIENKEIFLYTNLLKRYYIFIIALISLFGLIAVFAGLKYTYYPMRDLNLYIHKYLKLNNRNNLNEIETIKYTIDTMIEINHTLSKEVSDSNIITKDFYLFSLLNGNYAHFSSEYERHNEILVNSINEHKYFVAIAYFNTNNPVSSAELSLLDFKDCLDGQLEHYIFLLDRIIFLLCENSAKSKLEALKNKLSDGIGSYVTLSIGNVASAPENIWRSYTEATTALDYRFIKGINNIIYFSEIEFKNFDMSKYPTQDISLLIEHLKNGNIEVSLEIVKRIVDFIKENNIPIFFARCISFDIINPLLKILYGSLSNTDELQIDKVNITSLMKLDTLEQLTQFISNFYTLYSDYLIKRRNQKTNDFSKTIVDYIEQNFNSFDFTVERVANYFKMSQSHLRKIFKEYTGSTISEYVSNLQIEKAKVLLITTNMSVSEIIAEIRQTDPSSFIRKFKNKVGITPGEFRKQQSL